MKLETERLILREPKREDWKDIVEAMKDGSIAKNTAIIPHPYKKSDAVWFIDDCIKKLKEKEKRYFPFFIELKSEEKMIGVLSMEIKNSLDKVAVTGSWINPYYRRNRYMMEAKIAVNEFAFNKLDVRKLETEVFKGNKASNVTQVAMGYKYEGRRIESKICKATREIYDIELYGLLKKDWKRNLPALKKHLKEKIDKEKI